MRNGFNVALPLTQGVQYLSRQEEREVYQRMIDDDKARSNIPNMVLKDEDAVLVDYIKQSINNWLALPKNDQEEYLNIPAEGVKDPIPSVLNRYQIRLTHQIVRSEYPKLKTQGMGQFVQVTNLSAEQQPNEQELKAEAREREIANAVGFRWILEAIMGANISRLPHSYVRSAFDEGEEPKDCDAFIKDLQAQLRNQSRAIVGHNCLTDVINMYRCFIGDLPESVDEFRRELHDLFPMILDTKYLATIGSKRWANTSLRAVEEDLRTEGKPQLHLPSAFDRYLFAANYHEAGFDSFVTAKIGLKLPAKLKREGKDVALLAEQAKSAAEKANPVVEDNQQVAPAPSLPQQEGSPPGITHVAAAAITSPITTVKTLLTGQTPVTEDVTQSTGLNPQEEGTHPDTAAAKEAEPVLAVKEAEPRSTQTTKAEVQKLKSMSQNTNIFDMLEDSPSEGSQVRTEAEKKENERKRIAKMVQKGELLPRWEEDAALWNLIGNKLQANASREGILDLAKE